MKYTRLLLVLASCALYAGCERGQTPPPFSTQQAPEVVVSYPVVKEVTDYEDFPGRVEAINAVDVRARVTGYLQNMHFKEGSEVKKGELLFEIDPRPYEAELARTEGSVTQSEGHLRRLVPKQSAPLPWPRPRVIWPGLTSIGPRSTRRSAAGSAGATLIQGTWSRQMTHR